MSFAERTSSNDLLHRPAKVSGDGKLIPAGFDEVESVQKVAMMVWDPLSLSWIRGQQATGGSGGGGSGATIKTKRVDVASATVIYVGEAEPGVAESSTGWLIYKNTFDANGNPTGATVASGAWTNRANLSYQ